MWVWFLSPKPWPGRMARSGKDPGGFVGEVVGGAATLKGGVNPCTAGVVPSGAAGAAGVPPAVGPVQGPQPNTESGLGGGGTTASVAVGTSPPGSGSMPFCTAGSGGAMRFSSERAGAGSDGTAGTAGTATPLEFGKEPSLRRGEGAGGAAGCAFGAAGSAAAVGAGTGCGGARSSRASSARPAPSAMRRRSRGSGRSISICCRRDATPWTKRYQIKTCSRSSG